MSKSSNNTESFIICLDDDRDFLNSLRMSLPEKFQDVQGCNFLFMENPLETLEMIRDIQADSEQIALIMTDQMMPDMKGIDYAPFDAGTSYGICRNGLGHCCHQRKCAP